MHATADRQPVPGGVTVAACAVCAIIAVHTVFRPRDARGGRVFHGSAEVLSLRRWRRRP